ncbi:hypothetical protein RI367_005615 [Sorochytrium milnesiophthora]
MEATVKVQQVLVRASQLLSDTALDHGDQVASVCTELCDALADHHHQLLNVLSTTLAAGAPGESISCPETVLQLLELLQADRQHPVLLVRLLHLAALSPLFSLLSDVWRASAQQLADAFPDLGAHQQTFASLLCVMPDVAIDGPLLGQLHRPERIEAHLRELAMLASGATGETLSALHDQQPAHGKLIQLLSSKDLPTVGYALLVLLHTTLPSLSDKLFSEENMAQTLKLVIHLMQSSADACRLAARLMQALLRKKAWVAGWLLRYPHFDAAVSRAVQVIDQEKAHAVSDFLTALISNAELAPRVAAVLSKIDVIEKLARAWQVSCFKSVKDRGILAFMRLYMKVTLPNATDAQGTELAVSTICHGAVGVQPGVDLVLTTRAVIIPCVQTALDLVDPVHYASEDVARQAATVVFNYLDADALCAQARQHLNGKDLVSLYSLVLLVRLAQGRVHEWSATQAATQRDSATSFADTLLATLENKDVLQHVLAALHHNDSRKLALTCLLYYIRESPSNTGHLVVSLSAAIESAWQALPAGKIDEQAMKKDRAAADHTSPLSAQLQYLTLDSQVGANASNGSDRSTLSVPDASLDAILQQSCQTVVTAVRQQFASLQKSVQAMEAGRNDELGAARRRGDSLQAEVARLSQQLRGATDESQALGRTVKAQNTAQAALEASVTQLTQQERRDTVDQLTAQCAELQRRNQDSTATIAELRDAVAKSEAELARARDALQAALARSAELEQAKSTLETRANELQLEKQRLKERMLQQEDDAAAQSAQQQKKIGVLEDQIQELEAELEKHADLVNMLHEVTRKERERGTTGRRRAAGGAVPPGSE